MLKYPHKRQRFPAGRRNDNSSENFQANKRQKTEHYDESYHSSEEKTTFPQKKGGVPAREYHKDAKLKSWRMIVRNLPFKTTKEDLQRICSKFGTFTDIVLPPSKTMPKKIAGFAFIQFIDKSSAEQAHAWFNSNKIQGRMVAADYAMAKDDYETAAHDEREQLKKVKKEKESDAYTSKSKSKKEEPDESEAEEDDEESENASEESEELEDEEDSEEESEEVGDEEESSNSKKKVSKAQRPTKDADVAMSEGRVVFLRNLSFDTTEEQLREEIAQFGEVKLALICKFKDSGHSKGTAFVHFASKDSAGSCIDTCAQQSLNIGGRPIHGTIAIPKEDAAKIEKDKLTKVPKDKRNLRLLRFSIIREGTASANAMSSEDSAKRTRLAEAMKKKLENLHMFVSPVRLVVHNVPANFTDDRLRTVCREAAGTNAFVKECRIWKDMQRLDAKGNPKSKGFAFVTFTDHKDAMACMQALNNNPKTFTNERRPIVEFSIENLAALHAKERRSGKSTGLITAADGIIEDQVKDSIRKVHTAGMKFMPKFLGKKLRHRDMSKNQKKNIGISTKAKNPHKTAGKTFPKKSNSAANKKTTNKKKTTKYLALSG